MYLAFSLSIVDVACVRQRLIYTISQAIECTCYLITVLYLVHTFVFSHQPLLSLFWKRYNGELSSRWCVRMQCKIIIYAFKYYSLQMNLLRAYDLVKWFAKLLLRVIYVQPNSFNISILLYKYIYKLFGFVHSFLLPVSQFTYNIVWFYFVSRNNFQRKFSIHHTYLPSTWLDCVFHLPYLISIHFHLFEMLFVQFAI